jgi:hypothetical protein
MNNYDFNGLAAAEQHVIGTDRKINFPMLPL